MGTYGMSDEKSQSTLNRYNGNLKSEAEQILKEVEERKENLETNLSLVIRARRTAEIYKLIDAIGRDDESALDIARARNLVSESIVTAEAEIKQLVAQKLAEEKTSQSSLHQTTKETSFEGTSAQKGKKTQFPSKKSELNSKASSTSLLKSTFKSAKSSSQGVKSQSSQPGRLPSEPFLQSKKTSVPFTFGDFYPQQCNLALKKTSQIQPRLLQKKDVLPLKMPKQEDTVLKPYSQPIPSGIYYSSAIPLAPPCRTREEEEKPLAVRVSLLEEEREVLEEQRHEQLSNVPKGVQSDVIFISEELAEASVGTKNQPSKELSFQKLPSITIESKKYPVRENVKLVTFKEPNFNDDDDAIGYSGYQSYSNLHKEINAAQRETVDKRFSSAVGKTTTAFPRSEPELISKVIGQVYSHKPEGFKIDNPEEQSVFKRKESEENSNPVNNRLMKKLIVQVVKENIKHLQTSDESASEDQQEISEYVPNINDKEENEKQIQKPSDKEDMILPSPPQSPVVQSLSRINVDLRTPSRTPSPTPIEKSVPKSPSFSDSEPEEVFGKNGECLIPTIKTPELTPPESPSSKTVLTPVTTPNTEVHHENATSQESPILQKSVKDVSVQMTPPSEIKVNSESTLTTTSEETDAISEGECLLHRSWNKRLFNVSSSSVRNQGEGRISNIQLLDLQAIEQEQRLKSNSLDYPLSEGEIPDMHGKNPNSEFPENAQNDILPIFNNSSDEVSEISEGQIPEKPSNTHLMSSSNEPIQTGAPHKLIVHPNVGTTVVKLDKSLSDGEIADAGNLEDQNSQGEVPAYAKIHPSNSHNLPIHRPMHHSRLYFQPATVHEHNVARVIEPENSVHTSANETRFHRLSLGEVPVKDASSTLSEGQILEE